MSKEKKATEFVGTGTTSSWKFSFRDLLSGRFFTREVVVKQLPFFGFLTLLAFFYISNQFKVEKLLKQSATLNKEIQELRIEAITTSSDLMYVSKQSVVLEKVRKVGIDLEELTEPPRRIIIETDK